MGYREYLKKVDKNYYDKVKLVKTNRELYDITKKYYPNAVKNCDAENNKFYIPFYDIGETVYEFGKMYSGSKEINNKEHFFINDEIQKNDNPRIITEKDLEEIIRFHQKCIVEEYIKTIDFIENENYPTEKRLKKAKEFLDNNLFNCKYDGFVDLDRDATTLTDSWMFEHAIFNLVNLYKTFDWNNYMLVFFGY